MLNLETPSDLRSHVGEVLGHSKWLKITQKMINEFGTLTGDMQWIHVDEERSANESPDGKTIAHGLMIQSLAPMMMKQIYSIKIRGRGLNYGYDRIRFIAPVQVNDKIRMTAALIAIDEVSHGTKITCLQSFEIKGQMKPALIAENIVMILND